MKRLFISLIYISLVSLGYSQNLQFSYNTVNNGTTSEIQIFVQNSTSGNENMTSFTMNVYYDATESSYSSTMTTSLSGLGWFPLPSPVAFTAANNNAIPSTHTGFSNINILDFFGNGTDFGPTPTHLITIVMDNTIGSGAASAFYLSSSTEEHPEQVYNDNVMPVPNAHPIVMINGSFPVELLSFEAEAIDGGQSLLTWTTASELNNQGFKIQRINDDPNSANWEELGFVDGMGTTDKLTDYTFIDPNPRPGENLYRLQQVDFNGDFEYSEVRTVWFDQGVGVNVYPNPTSSYVNVKFEELNYDKDTATYTVQDQRGRLVFEGKLDALKISQIDFSKLPEGTYYLKLEYDGKAAVKEIVRIN